MVHSRTGSEKKEERYDLFSSLLDNTGDEDGTAKLTEDELMGEFPECLSGRQQPHVLLQGIYSSSFWPVMR